MKKIITFSITLLLVSIALLGCQEQDNKIELKEEIKEVNIFQSNEFKKDSSDLIISSRGTGNRELLKTVKSIIDDATKQEGIVDITEPDYDLEVVYEDGSTKELYLWLMEDEEGKGSLMEVEDTHTVYNFREELNSKLIDLIDSSKDQPILNSDKNNKEILRKKERVFVV